MNGYNLLDEAAKLLGLDSADENMKIIGLPLLNEIIVDLGFMPLASLSETLGIAAPATLSALRFGVAALVANAVGEKENATALFELYSQKKTRLSSKIERVKDVLPRGEQ